MGRAAAGILCLMLLMGPVPEDGPVMGEVELSAVVTLDGKAAEDASFLIRLISEDGQLLHTRGNQGSRVTFPTLTFSHPGIYRYFLKGEAGTDSGLVYDRTVYTVTVTVTSGGTDVAYARNGRDYWGTPAFLHHRDQANPNTGDTIVTAFTVLVFSCASLAILLIFQKRI